MMRKRESLPYRRLLACVFGLLLLLCLNGAATEAPQPTAQELESVFTSSRGRPWSIGREGEFSRTLRAPAGKCWDLRSCVKLSVLASRDRAGSSIARLRWVVRTRGGEMFAPGQPVIVPLLTAGPVRIFFDDLLPLGHQRRWDAMTAAEVTEIELRAECTFGARDEKLTVLLSNVSLGVTETAAAARPPAILDLQIHPPPAGIDAQASLTFSITPAPQDPFAASGEGDVRVLLPDGKQALAFFDQDYLVVEDGSATRSVPAGAPLWRAFLPSLPQGGALEIVNGEQRWKIALAGIPQAAAETTSVSQERWIPPLQMALQESLEPDGVIPKLWRLNGSSWTQSPAARPKSAWRPVPFWKGTWSGFGDTLRPDAILARRMDELLAQAAAGGQRLPLVILDGEGFSREGDFNWLHHPLNGHRLTSGIAGPGSLFRSAEGKAFCERWMRYCIARWGRSKAVSGFLLTPDQAAPGAPAFFAHAAQLLQNWTQGPGWGASPPEVLSFNPLTLAPQTTRALGTFETQDQRRFWRPEAQTQRTVVDIVVDDQASAGTASLELRAFDARAQSVSVNYALNEPLVDYRKTEPDNFFDADAIVFDVRAAPGAPPDLRVGIHVRDRNSNWFEALLPGMLTPGDWKTYILDISARNSHGLKGLGHDTPWNGYSRQRVTEIGLHLFSAHKNWTTPAGHVEPLSVRFDDVRAARFKKEAPAATLITRIFPRLPAKDVRPVRAARDVPAPIPVNAIAERPLPVGGLWEAHFEINKVFANPFDLRDCDLAALITTPSGKQVRVPAFFDQLCVRDELQPGGAEVVVPAGAEFFTVRYRALEAGPHRVTLELREGGSFDIVGKTKRPDPRFSPEGRAQEPLGRNPRTGRTDYMERYETGKRDVEKIAFRPGAVTATFVLPAAAFVVSAEEKLLSGKPFRGFVRTAADKRHFQMDDGTFFYPLGPCLRSPSDSRTPYPDMKWNDTEIDRIGKRGSYQYDDYFTEFEKAGLNWGRVWMCAWWGGLEWRRDWPGFQGLGRYNLLNAWRMDHLFKVAEEKGIYIDLCLINHGQFSLHIDAEWNNNPFNAHLGGPLTAASEFFSRADAKILHYNRLRYIAARYAHSPAVMGWALFSEVEWTEEYEPSLIWRGVDTPAPLIESWHTEMAAVLREYDPNKHLITTHYSYPQRGEGTLMLPAIDYATSNAYSAFDDIWGEFRFDAAGALSGFWSGNQFIKGFHIFNKPALVEEQGRHWAGKLNNTKQQLDADLHAGLWGSVMQPLGGATGYWWWLHLHFDKRYDQYTAVSKFMEGEDMRPANGEALLEPAFRIVEATGANAQVLRGRALKSDRRMYAWIYHLGTPKGVPVPDVPGGVFKVGGLIPGKYEVQFWDTYKGTVIEAHDAEVKLEDGKPSSIQLTLPVVKRDLAVKVKLK